MFEAAAHLGVHFSTFKKHATRLGVYKPADRSMISKRGNDTKTNALEEILAGNRPSYGTYHLGQLILKAGLLEYKCSECGIREWQGKRIGLELDHIDGVRTNHVLSNLRFLCPNCHSQTSTFKSKNRK